MTNLPERLGRLCRLAILSLVTALAGCGPGTGGTGTGPVQGVLNFSGSAAQGASPSEVQCQGDCARIDLRLEAQQTELTAGCRRFVHVGDWTVPADGKAVIEGRVETTTATGTASAPAMLQLQFSERNADSPQVTAILTGDGGSLLAGPAVLLRGEGAAVTAPLDCTRP